MPGSATLKQGKKRRPRYSPFTRDTPDAREKEQSALPQNHSTGCTRPLFLRAALAHLKNTHVEST